jgi:biopolymer transport protein TolR
MAVTVTTGASRGRGRYRPMAEINVTPMVDVMLVLLVIFMITAPLLTVGVPVDLPKTKAASINEAIEPLVISINAEGKVFLQETETPIDSLVPRLQAITLNKPDTRIFVRGDKSVPYGQVVEVMGLVSSAGFTHVALVAEMPRGGPSPLAKPKPAAKPESRPQTR